MPYGDQETEAKFYVRDLTRFRSYLEQNARLIHERVLETNIRFDLPGAPLRAEGRVLRLRRDTSARFTYKGASTSEEGVLSREEVEFEVGDFAKARRFLEALGYEKLVYYEKYRTTYGLPATGSTLTVMLDELPYGHFIEIEGESVPAIREAARELGLAWEAAIAASYNTLFDRVRSARNLSIQDLSFARFADIRVEARDLGVRAADE